MQKKRIIFTLLYSDGQFLISRNFKIQKIGDLNWLKKNYNFSEIAKAIDELVILNVGKKDNKSFNKFCEILKKVTEGIFVPVAAGGGIDNLEKAKKILRSGSDKIVINTLILHKMRLVEELINMFGSQCVVISIDLIKTNKVSYKIWDNKNKLVYKLNLSEYIEKIMKYKFGEIYLTSIDKDGTGQGYDFNMLKFFKNISTPIIISGGAGNWKHLHEGLLNKYIDAVSTANLLNFVDQGLILSRKNILNKKFDLPIW